MAHVLVVDSGELGELLTTLLGQYGIAAVGARTGEQALSLALEHAPALAVVDQNLSDASGLDLAELLRTELNTKAVLMYPQQLLADADQDALSRIAALDGSFLRPFRSLTLVEFVAKLLNVSLRPVASDAPAALSSAEGAPVAEPADGTDIFELTVAVDGQDEQGASGDTAVAAPLKELTAKADTRTFSPGALTELWQQVKARRSTSKPPAPASREGTLSPRALANVLDAFFQSQTTGEVWLENGRARRVIFLRRGVIAGARSNLEGENMLALATAKNLLESGAVVTIRDDVTQGGRKTVLDALLARQLISHENLALLVRDLARLVTLRAFTWRAGSFRVAFDGLATKEPLTAQVAVGEMIVRGILLTEDDAALTQAAPDDARFTPAADAGHGLHDLNLSKAEAKVVVAMDGTKTIRDLCVLFDDLPARSIRGLAAGLLCVGLVRFVGWGPAEARKISYF
jgi:CheY-like chemotaxis protein